MVEGGVVKESDLGTSSSQIEEDIKGSEGVRFDPKPLVLEQEPQSLGLGSQNMGKLRTTIIVLTTCYWKLLLVKTGSRVMASL